MRGLTSEIYLKETFVTDIDPTRIRLMTRTCLKIHARYTINGLVKEVLLTDPCVSLKAVDGCGIITVDDHQMMVELPCGTIFGENKKIAEMEVNICGQTFKRHIITDGKSAWFFDLDSVTPEFGKILGVSESDDLIAKQVFQSFL